VAARNVLITGGSSGIGAALVRAFHALGDTVWLTYHRGQARADALVAELPRSRAFPLAQGEWPSHQALMDALPGPVDVLINNAGLGSATVARQADESHAQDALLMQVNAVGPLWLCEAVIPSMRQRGYGKIVQIASVGGGITQFPQFRLADGMSKAALGHLTRQLAAEHARSPIDCFAICPGATETPMFEASTLDALSPSERAAFVARLPKGRLIAPEEIAQVAVFLCSEAGRVMHGAVLDASAGLGVHPGLLTGGGS